jgi:putative DNA primase/helicase
MKRKPMTTWDVLDHMTSHGVGGVETLNADGRIHRFKVDGSRKKNGWYWFVERNGQYFGVYGDWASGHTVKLGADTREFRELRQEKRVAAVDESVRAADKANAEWGRLALTGSSEYLKRKGIPGLGVRFGADFIAVPMFRKGELVGLQKIYDDGRKRFTFGCAKKGAYMRIFGMTPAVVCEGYATGVSIHVATGFEVIVAFDAGNLLPVAQTAREDNPAGPILIAGDNDHGTAGNPGRTAAEIAGAAINARWCVPYGIDGTDFNDCMLECGALDVHLQIIDAL